MAFNTAYLLKSRFGSPDYTEGLDEIKISMEIDWEDGVNRGQIEISDNYSKKEINTDDKDLYMFGFRPQFGFHLRPYHPNRKNLIGPMCNGMIAEVNSTITSQLEKMVGYPISKYISVHDRYETQEMYDALCR